MQKTDDISVLIHKAPLVLGEERVRTPIGVHTHVYWDRSACRQIHERLSAEDPSPYSCPHPSPRTDH